MDDSSLVQNAIYFAHPSWLPWVLGIALLMAVISSVSYYRSRMPLAYRVIAVSLRMLGIGLLLTCLLEPMGSEERIQPQSNAFAILVDNSQSTKEDWLAQGGKTSKDSNSANANAEQWFRGKLADDARWMTKLAENFRVRRYLFDDSVDAIDSFEGIQQSEMDSSLVHSLVTLAQRYPRYQGREPRDTKQANLGQPLGGILLFSDGQATDRSRLDELKKLGVPVYPVVHDDRVHGDDLALAEVTSQQSDFETAPLTLAAKISHHGFTGKTAYVHLEDSEGKLLETKPVVLQPESQSTSIEFRFRPEKLGVQGFRMSVSSNEIPPDSVASPDSEWTLRNNARYEVIDRGRGPYRILYLAGRPNWEHKFLSRALAEDQEIELTSLVRIAKKAPKFTFRDSRVESSNPLFSGFEDISEEEKEQYDEPVFARLGVKESGELQKGFPKDLAELFQYRAILIDDLEHDFFTQEQQSMLRQFVSVRGGGLLALGGQESMRGDSFGTSVLAQLLPIYGEEGRPEDSEWTSDPNTAEVSAIRMNLTRDGWLQPFMRLANNEAAETKRLESMPYFGVWNRVRDLKPGASVLATGESDGNTFPLLVTQRFGRGRSAAMLLGDQWRWAMHRSDLAPPPLYQAWRQLVRWIITDVPAPILFRSESLEGSPRTRKLSIDLKGSDFQVVDNATVRIAATKPDGVSVELLAEPSTSTPGRYEATYVCDAEGVYVAEATCTGEDGVEIGRVEAGWVHDPKAAEFKNMGQDSKTLSAVAESTGGKLVNWRDLDSFADNVPSQQVPIKERRTYPLWHQSWVVVAAIFCLCAEWGWRRRYGMA